MIYGVNFNGLVIPTSIAQLFPSKGKHDGRTYDLCGVCETQDELDRMLIVADNGKRVFHSISRGAWFALYTTHKES